MDSFEKKVLELQEQLYTDGYDYSLYQVRLALAQWLVQSSHHLIENASDYIFGNAHPIASDAFRPEDFPVEESIATINPKRSKR